MKSLLIIFAVFAGLGWGAQNLYVEAYSEGYEKGAKEAWDRVIEQQKSIATQRKFNDSLADAVIPVGT